MTSRSPWLCRIVSVLIAIARRDRMTRQWSRFRGVLGLCAAFGLIAGCMTQLRDAGDDGSPAATSAVEQDIGGGGGSNCSPPRDDCPTFPPPSCSGKAFCYC